MLNWKFFGALVLSSVAALPLTAVAGTIQNAGYDRYHQKLAEDEAYDPVGLITAYDDEGNAYSMGSGSLIKRNFILTAAHVVDTAHALSFEIDGNIYFAKQWFVPNRWVRTEGTLGLNNDIALIQLTSAIKKAPVLTVNTKKRQARGKEVVSVGYGNTGTGATGQILGTAGTKRAGPNRVDVDDPFSRELMYDFDSSTPHLYPSADILYELDEWDDFNNLGGQKWEREDLPIGKEYMIAQGDSGGPVIYRDKIVGIHSWGVQWGGVLSGFGGVAASTDVAYWYNWIQDVLENRQHADRTTRGRFGDPIFGADDGGGTSVSSALIDRARELGAPIDWYVMTQPVPEPTTVALLGMTGALFVLRRARH